MKICRWLGCCMMLLLFTSGAHGLIAKLTFPMKKLVKDSTYVVVTKVTLFDPENKKMILTVTEDLKGKATLRQITILLAGDDMGKRLNHIPLLTKRLALDLPVVLFSQRDAMSDNITAYAYTNGTWFKLAGKAAGAQEGVWDLLHGVPDMRRTFKGTTEEMRKVVKNYLTGADQLPAFNEKEAPGFGPEISK